MLVASEVKGELARIVPARTCCRRAELVGLLYADRAGQGLRTLDHGTARIAVQLAGSLGLPVTAPKAPAVRGARPGRHHLVIDIDGAAIGTWSWASSPACDRRSFLRGVLLGNGSVSMGAHGPHVEFVYRTRAQASELLRRLAQSGAHGALAQRRGRWIVYLKGLDEIATLLQLAGANRGLLDFETGRVAREMRNRLNRLLNAEEANLGRTVRAADAQLQAIAALEVGGRLRELPEGLRAAAAQRRLHPESDLDTLSDALGISRSAANHRLRRLVLLARQADGWEHAAPASRRRGPPKRQPGWSPRAGHSRNARLRAG
jgi:hypothetical protein